MGTIHYIGPERQFSDIRRSTMDELVEWCKDKEVIALDTETSGLDHTKERAILLQIGDMDHQWCIDLRFEDPSRLIPFLESAEVVGHNLKFDYCFLRRYGIRLQRIWDTMLAEQVLHCGKKDYGFGLKDVASEYLGVTIDKSVRNLFIHMQGQPFSDKQLVYGAKDIEHLISIRALQIARVSEQELVSVVKLENRACLAFADIEYNGMDMDVEKWLSISSEEAVKVVRLRSELDALVLSDKRFESIIPKYVQGDLFGEPRRLNTNWDSPSQVLKVMKCVEPGLAAVNATDLFPFRRDPMIKLYLEYKETCKLVSSYGQAFLDERYSDGKIHTSFKQILNTGRVSSSKPKTCWALAA